jgi:hypothetical protein
MNNGDSCDGVEPPMIPVDESRVKEAEKHRKKLMDDCFSGNIHLHYEKLRKLEGSK